MFGCSFVCLTGAHSPTSLPVENSLNSAQPYQSNVCMSAFHPDIKAAAFPSKCFFALITWSHSVFHYAAFLESEVFKLINVLLRMLVSSLLPPADFCYRDTSMFWAKLGKMLNYNLGCNNNLLFFLMFICVLYPLSYNHITKRKEKKQLGCCINS